MVPETLANRPGTTNFPIRPVQAAAGSFTPTYLGTAIPTGPEEDGRQQFVSQPGLPAHEALGHGARESVKQKRTERIGVGP